MGLSLARGTRICFCTVLWWRDSGHVSEVDENSESLKKQQPTTMLLFDQFEASFSNERPREELLFGLAELHKNPG